MNNKILFCWDKDQTLDLNEGPVPYEWLKMSESMKGVENIIIGNQNMIKDHGHEKGRDWVLEKCGYNSKWEASRNLIAKYPKHFIETLRTDIPKNLTLAMIDTHMKNNFDRIILVDDKDISLVNDWGKWEFYFPDEFLQKFKGFFKWQP